jgi:hypothetical protein
MKSIISGKRALIVLLSLISLNLFGQTTADTIYTNGERIACTVKAVGQDAVNFVYPGEEVINTLYKNTIQKIVFKSGRVQTFAESTSYKTVTGASDFDNVTLTRVPGEVKGLFKVGDVTSKARGTTTLASMEKVKERATRKLKIVAAMMGANIIYLNQDQTTDNQMGTRFEAGHATATNLSGVAYSNKLPSFDDFQKRIGDKTSFTTYDKILLSGSDADYEESNFANNVQILKIYNESGLIMVNANIDGINNPTFRVISFTDLEFTLVWKDGDDIYNFKIRFGSNNTTAPPATTQSTPQNTSPNTQQPATQATPPAQNTSTQPVTFNIGDRVSVSDDGKWVTGIITAITANKTYLVKWDDNGKTDEVPEKEMTKSPNQNATFNINDKVSYNDNGAWVTGTVEGKTTKGTYMVKWDDNGKIDEMKGYELSSDLVHKPAFAAGDKVAYNDNGNWVTGVVQSITAKNTYLVKWDDNGKTDEMKEKELTKLVK